MKHSEWISDKWSVAGLRSTYHDREMLDCRAIAAKGNHSAVGRAVQRHMSRNNLTQTSDFAVHVTEDVGRRNLDQPVPGHRGTGSGTASKAGSNRPILASAIAASASGGAGTVCKTSRTAGCAAVGSARDW